MLVQWGGEGLGQGGRATLRLNRPSGRDAPLHRICDRVHQGSLVMGPDTVMVIEYSLGQTGHACPILITW